MSRHLLRPRTRHRIHPNKKTAFTYILDDEFTNALSAGSVNATGVVPGPGGARGVLDGNSKLSITGGKLSFATGGVASNDPTLIHLSSGFARLVGRILLATVNMTSGRIQLGWNSATSLVAATISSGRQGTADFNAGTLNYVPGIGSGITVGAHSTGTDYLIALIHRAAGTFFFIKGGSFTNWTLLYINTTEASATLYPFFTAVGTTAVGVIDSVKVPVTIWLPVPLASDGFGSTFGTTDGLGTPEGIAGGTGSGGGSVSWTQQTGTWANTTGKCSAATLSGGIAIATVPASNKDVMIDIKVTRSAGQGGSLMRYTDASNYLYANHDGTNCFLKQVLAGATTTLITAAATYSANAVLRVDLSGQAARLYYNNVLVGTTASINAGLTATPVGLYVTDTSVQLDDFVVYAKGSGNEHSALDAF